MDIKYLVFLSLLCFTTLASSQSSHKNLRDGDMLYGFGKFGQAETEYRRAESSKPTLKSSYNLGNTLMLQERYDEAAIQYQNATQRATTDAEKAAVYHNQGNALYNKQKYQESVEAYKNALKHQPNDISTKENLALARQELRKQQQQQKENQQKDQPNKDNQDKNKEDQQQDQKDNPNDQKQDQQQDENQQQDQKNSTNDDKKPKEQPKSDGQMSAEDAKKLLDIMDNEEKKVQQKLRRSDTGKNKTGKDW